MFHSLFCNPSVYFSGAYTERPLTLRPVGLTLTMQVKAPYFGGVSKDQQMNSISFEYSGKTVWIKGSERIAYETAQKNALAAKSKWDMDPTNKPLKSLWDQAETKVTNLQFDYYKKAYPELFESGPYTIIG